MAAAPCLECGDVVTRWRTVDEHTGDPGTVCATCFTMPKLVPPYIKRCPTCGAQNWGFTGHHDDDGFEVWGCVTCRLRSQAEERHR